MKVSFEIDSHENIQARAWKVIEVLTWANLALLIVYMGVT